jgi:hypothetical protein
MYLFTVDGLFVSSLFRDVRAGASWNMPVSERNMLLNGVSPHDEKWSSKSTLLKIIDGDVSTV